MPEVTSINVGSVREVSWRGRRIRTGIWKTPIDGPSVMVRGVNLFGEVVSRPEHRVTLREMIEAAGDQERLRALLRARELPAYWRRS